MLIVDDTKGNKFCAIAVTAMSLDYLLDETIGIGSALKNKLEREVK